MHMKIFFKYILDGFFRMRSLIQLLDGNWKDIHTFNGNYFYSKVDIYMRIFSNVKIIRKTFCISLKKEFENCRIFYRTLVSSEHHILGLSSHTYG